MPVNRRQLLETLVRYSDEHCEPVTVSELVEEFDHDREPVREHLEALQSHELVRQVEDQQGYIPTVTARDLLALDIDEDTFIIIDLPDDD